MYALCHTPATKKVKWRGERVIEPIKCMPHHTPATGGEERESCEPIKCMRLGPTHQQTVARGERVQRVNPVPMRSTTHQLQVEEERRDRANQVYAPHHNTSYRWRGERVHRSPHSSVCARPHTSYRDGERRESWAIRRCSHHKPDKGVRGEREVIEANQVYVLATPKLTGGRGRESHRANQNVCARHTQLQVAREERETSSHQGMRSPHTSYRV